MLGNGIDVETAALQAMFNGSLDPLKWVLGQELQNADVLTGACGSAA